MAEELTSPYCNGLPGWDRSSRKRYKERGFNLGIIAHTDEAGFGDASRSASGDGMAARQLDLTTRLMLRREQTSYGRFAA